MSIYTLNPLTDDRWAEFIAHESRSSVFHRREWLEALSRTYQYEPFVLTSARAGEALRDGVVFCSVSSWITGKRVVSLPFTDHCDPLLDRSFSEHEFSDWCQATCKSQNWKYLEVRPVSQQIGASRAFQCAEWYWLHTLDLSPSLEQLHHHLHKNSFQRRIRKAERERLSYEVGSSDLLLNEFYALLLKTRRRHHLVPQPKSWFKNLAACFGRSLEIRLARKNDLPIAAILTLRHGSKVYYKYGCSDQHLHYLAGMPYLFWKLIEDSKSSNATEIDFGRSDPDHQGLITFKDRLGTIRKPLRYLRCSQTPAAARGNGWITNAVRSVFSVLPDSVSPAVGSLLYRHIG